MFLLGLLLHAAPAAAQNARQIVFHNDRTRPVRIMIHHADQPRNWHPHAWWNFAPKERSYLTWEGRRLTQLDNHDIYFLAEATDGSRTVWNGNGARYNRMACNTACVARSPAWWMATWWCG